MNWLVAHLVGDYLLQNDWMALNKKLMTFPCVVHCSAYTAAVASCTWWPWWALLAVFVTHFIQDRTQIIRWWMNLIGQEKFAGPPLGPWSIIVVDNVWHIVVLFGLSKLVAE